ncbi:MAG: ATP-binding protein [Verrucomicrobia bacterium]|nr:ATP-binding protein [Verrucomicrobiota bacterium]
MPPLYTWQDLVLPLRTQQQLREICLAVKHRTLVHERWGFGRRLALGRGLNALFAGPSGTGKTMAAQVLARELGLDLFQIDLAHVVSKYIGETEKHLDAIFRAAQSSNAILFFDEADALFGKRTEVKDAHDRYANLEVAYLLQKMESYEGIVILATNLGKNIDDAFRRRLQHSLEFPFPEPDLRERIWRGAFPRGPPGPGPRFPLPRPAVRTLGRQHPQHHPRRRRLRRRGPHGHLNPAADAPPAISMQHVIAATARELQKMGKLPTRSEFGPHFDCLRDRP